VQQKMRSVSSGAKLKLSEKSGNSLTLQLLEHHFTACVFDISLYLTPLGQARQFIETCGT
jgi:hypothetical protein